MKKANFIRLILPLIIICGSIFCIRNGVVVSKLPELNTEPNSMLIFYIISLFTFGAKDFGAPIAGHWILQSLMWLFYFVSPLVTLIAMADILSIIRPLYVKYVLNFRPYYLIMGYGRIGKSALEAIHNKIGKNTYTIILDKNIDDSENNFTVVFEHSLMLQKNLLVPDNWKPFITKRCKGVYILTDKELLNLSIYNELKLFLSSKGLSNIEVFTRIRSLEIFHRLGINNGKLSNDGKETTSSHYFINVHQETPNLLFNSTEIIDVLNAQDPIKNHFNTQLIQFNKIKQINFDSFVFIGFGTFSSCFFVHLIEQKIIFPNSKIIIIDPFARKNWGSFVLDRPSTEIYDPQLFENNFEELVDAVHPKLEDLIGMKSLCFFATNDEERNIQLAAYFTRKQKTCCQVYSIIRTKYIDVMQPDLVDALVGKDKWVMIPTYTWIKLCFDQKISK
jgi:hypothetical protein